MVTVNHPIQCLGIPWFIHGQFSGAVNNYEPRTEISNSISYLLLTFHANYDYKSQKCDRGALIIESQHLILST